MADKKSKPKPVYWLANSKKDLKRLPEKVQNNFEYGLFLAQIGTKADNAKVLKGFGSAGVIEIIANENGNTYRGVYTVKFRSAVYVLHVFQKKSKQGIATPQQEINLIKERLKIAEDDYKKWSRKK